MMALASVSRRVLIAAAAAAAIDPEVSDVSARTRKAPQAFVMANVYAPYATSPAKFGINFEAAFTYPASDTGYGDFNGGIAIDSQVPSDQLRKQVIAEIRKKTAEHLASKGYTVAADRIAVTLL